MGQDVSKSLVHNINNQLYVDRSVVNIMTDKVNEVVANTIVNNAVETGASIINNNEFTFKNFYVEQGDIDIGGVSQEQDVAITFSQINISEITNEIDNKVIQTILDEMQKHTSIDTIAEMEAAASTKKTTGFAAADVTSIGKSETTESEVINESNFISIDASATNIVKAVTDRVINNFTTNNLSKCLVDVIDHNSSSFVNMTVKEGSIKIQNLTQKQAVNAIANCETINKSANSTVSEILQDLGVKVDESSSISNIVDQSGKASTEVIKKGPFESLGDMFSGMFSGLNSIMYAIIAVIVGGVLIVGVIFLYKMFASGSGSSVPAGQYIQTMPRAVPRAVPRVVPRVVPRAVPRVVR